MSKLDPMTERFLEAFVGGGSIVIDCGCGVTHFFTYGNEGTFNPGELEELLAKAAKHPKKYVEHHYSSSSDGNINGERFVMDCECLEERFGQMARRVWNNRFQIASFIRKEAALRLKAAKETSEAIAATDRELNKSQES